MKFNKKRSVFYCNILVLDVSKAVRQEVSQNFKELPDPIRDNLAMTASELVKPEMLVENSVLTEKTIEMVHVKLGRKGISVDVETVYSEGSYFVLQVQVTSVDIEKMAEMSSCYQSALVGCTRFLLGLLGESWKESLERYYLPTIIQMELTKVMGDIMKEDFREERVEADPVVLGEAQQARFFFEMVRHQQYRKTHQGHTDRPENPFPSSKLSDAKKLD